MDSFLSFFVAITRTGTSPTGRQQKHLVALETKVDGCGLKLLLSASALVRKEEHAQPSSVNWQGFDALGWFDLMFEITHVDATNNPSMFSVGSNRGCCAQPSRRYLGPTP